MSLTKLEKNMNEKIIDGVKYTYFEKPNGIVITNCETDLRYVNIPDKINDIEVIELANQAFSKRHLGIDSLLYNSLTGVKIPNSVQKIGYETFLNNYLISIQLPKSLIEIGSDAFKNNQVSELRLPEGVITIEDGAFESNNLSELFIPASVKEIGYNAFKGNPLTKIIISGDRSRFDDYWDYIGFHDN